MPVPRFPGVAGNRVNLTFSDTQEAAAALGSYFSGRKFNVNPNILKMSMFSIACSYLKTFATANSTTDF